MQKIVLLSLAMTSSVAMSAATDAAVIHAYQMGDATQKFGYVSFPVNDLTGKKVDKSTSGYVDQLGAADYVDGKLYGFTLEVDDFGSIYTSEYVVLDPSAGFKQERYVSKYLENRVADMAYDYVSNRMYALVELGSGTGKVTKTALHVVDLTTGDTRLVGLPGDLKALDGYGREVEEILITLAASPSGDLYAMGDYRQFYKVDKLTGEAAPVGAPHKIAIDNGFQSMAFSADGNLYHAHLHPDYEYFMRIDPSTGKLYNPETGEEVLVNKDFTNNACRISGDPQLTSLYFTDREVDKDAPAAVSSAKAVLREGTSNTVDLSWSLPKADISAVYVYRFGTSDVLAKLPADAVSYVDDSAPNGKVVYSVVAVSGDHIGHPAYAEVQSGADRLKAVSDLKAVLDGNSVELCWTAPTATVSGGYADYDNINYIITEINGSKRTVLTDKCAETSYKTHLSGGGTYSYEVVAVNCGMEGEAAYSNEITMGQSFSVPYFTGFEDEQDGTLWTVKNKGSNPSYGWSIIKGYAYQQYDGKFAQFKTGGSATIPSDDWIISPAIAFEPGDYVLSYFATGGSFDAHTYEIALGTNPDDAETFSNVIERVDGEKVYDASGMNGYAMRTAKFSVAASGAYHIGLHGVGSSTFATMKFDNLAVDEDETGGIADIAADGGDSPLTVVSIDGRVLMRDAAPEALGSLQPGLYIVNGRKVFITK